MSQVWCVYRHLRQVQPVAQWLGVQIGSTSDKEGDIRLYEALL